jgi:hypothetical protein
MTMMKLAIVATPLLLASSAVANAVRYGKIDIKLDGEIHGCVGPDMLWNVDGNCATYKAMRWNWGGDESEFASTHWSMIDLLNC